MKPALPRVITTNVPERSESHGADLDIWMMSLSYLSDWNRIKKRRQLKVIDRTDKQRAELSSKKELLLQLTLMSN